MNTKMKIAGGALGLLLAGPALAQAKGFDEPTIAGGAVVAAPVLPRGFAIQAGGGVTGYSKQDARDLFGTGGYWDVRAIFGTDSFLGAEVAYVGSSRSVAAPGLVGSNMALMGNGAEANLRANLPLNVGPLGIEPYVFGGVGWTHYNVINADANSSLIQDHTDAGVVPFGAGFSVAYDQLMLDARFTYRSMFSNKLVATGTNDHLDMQNWSAGMTVGYRF
jgi:hypothetical protein